MSYKQVTLEQLSDLITKLPSSIKFIFIEVIIDFHNEKLTFPIEKYTALVTINNAITNNKGSKFKKVFFSLKDNNLYFHTL